MPTPPNTPSTPTPPRTPATGATADTPNAAADPRRGPRGPLVTGYPSTMGDDVQLNTTTIIRHAARTFGAQEIVYRTDDGGWARYTIAGAFDRIGRAAGAFRRLGIDAGDRVAVLDWNSRRHFELYWSIPGIAAVMVQLNLRLGPDDLAYVIGDSGSRAVCVDESLLPVAEAIAGRFPDMRWIIMSDRPLAEIETSLPDPVHFEDALAAESPDHEWPEIDEKSAFCACYTTGTTGSPKGVYYSHRSVYLHSSALVMNIGLDDLGCTMLITPMFHASGWGLPQAATMAGQRIVLPGRYRAEESGPLVDVLVAEKVTVTNGAPAIFRPMLDYIETLEEKPDLSGLRMMSGASEPPLSLVRGFHELTGAEIVHAYGATETSPLATANLLTADVLATKTEGELFELKRKQGYPVVGVDLRLLDAGGEDVPWDGESVGEICLRGPWITATYHGMSDEELEGRFVDGYWRSGDVGFVDEDGYLKVTDRIKDVIKSGGEWISSIDMENLLTSLPGIADVAVVGLAHPEWQERPFVLAVVREGESVTLADIHAHLAGAFASWQLPEAVEFVGAIPKTSVGKLDKRRIRSEYAGYYAGAAGS